MDYPCHSPHEQRWFWMSVSSFDAADECGVVISHCNVIERTLSAKEVSHRSKNLLNLVQAIALQAIKANPEEFSCRFTERIQSLTVTQDLLVHNVHHHISLPELVTAQLGHFSQFIGDRLVIEGPFILLNARAAQALGMTLHELGTNAAKYGALTIDNGHILLKWHSDPSQRQFEMSWLERGGHTVHQPAPLGFGSSLIVDAIKAAVTLSPAKRAIS